jgi:CheY-like chemotaxis protein
MFSRQKANASRRELVVSSMRVLFVDDDPAVAQSVKTVLRSKGHSCRTTDLGEQAIALAKQDSYDVIVLDVGLPDIDGYHVFRRMKMERVETPVLMQSGLAGRDLAAEAAELGIKDVLVKPFSVAELIERIETIMARCQPRDPVPEVRPRAQPVAQAKPAAQAQPKPEPAANPKPRAEPGTTAKPAPVPRQERPARSEARQPPAPSSAASAAAPAPQLSAKPALGPAARPAPRPALGANPQRLATALAAAQVPKAGPPPAAASAVAPAPSPSATPAPSTAPTPNATPSPGPTPSPAAKPAANPATDSPTPSKAQPGQAAARQDSPGKSGAERRRHERIPTVQAALISEQGRHMACVILNISEGGAALKLSEASQDCPKYFNLQQLDGPERRCEMRWRNGAQMGVMFIQESSKHL